MVYISGGRVLNNRPSYGLSMITDTFWGIVDFVFLFFRSLVMPGSDSNPRVSSGSRGDRWGGGGGGRPRRRMGGFGGSSNSPAPPPMAGGG